MMQRELKKIAYAEDDPDINFIIKMTLEASGIQVLNCANGHELVEKASAFLPDLFLLDVMMPGIDGPETLKALRAIPQFAKIPVIFMTAKVQPHEVEQYKKMDALDVIFKPFDPLKLAQEITAIWQRGFGG